MKALIEALIVACLVLATVSSPAADLKGGNPNPGIAPPNSTPLGASYAEWIAQSSDCFYDFSLGQLPSPVLVSGHMIVPPQLLFQDITIPVAAEPGRWLFVPLLFTSWANAPGDPGYGKPWDTPFTDPDTGIAYPTYEAWVREIMDASIEGLSTTCTVDGKLLQAFETYRLQSDLFQLVIPEDNLWGLPAGDYSPGLTVGWFIILPPLTPGVHNVCNTFGDWTITYEVTVTPPGKK